MNHLVESSEINRYKRYFRDVSRLEREELHKFYDIYNEGYYEFSDQVLEEIKKHNDVWKILQVIPSDTLDAQRELSRKLQQEAIYQDNWDPYIENLVTQGASYFKMGITFRSWYLIVNLLKQVLLPAIERKYSTDADSARSAIRGMDKFLENAICVIGESYTQNIKDEKAQAFSEMEKLVYMVSHDLKQPLRSIAMLVDNFLQSYNEQTEESKQEVLKHLKERARKAYGMVESLLAWSKTGDVLDDEHPASLEASINASLKTVQSANPTRFDFEAKGPMPRLALKSLSLDQVLTNLISNAVKHNDKEIPAILIEGFYGLNHFVLKVSDNGPGVPEGMENIMFDMFTTLRESNGESTGIGLPIVKAIMDSAGGEIQVKSNIGLGTTFLLYFPNHLLR